MVTTTTRASVLAPRAVRNGLSSGQLCSVTLKSRLCELIQYVLSPFRALRCGPSSRRLRNLLELAAFAVFPDAVPRKAFAVHGNVNSGWQNLHKGESAAEIEEAVRAAKGIGDHRAKEHNGFSSHGSRHGGGA